MQKKGFTLIELMIVIAIIALLSTVLLPKVDTIKLQSKNNSVTTNVLLVRTYLENRGGKDGISYQQSISGGHNSTHALTTILNNIGTDMTANFFGSNALVNPFNNNSSINYANGNIANNNPSSASVVLGYDSIKELPTNDNAVSTTLPSGTNYIGDVIVMIYNTGYVVYGVDNNGQMINIYIIKFPPTPPVVQSGVTNGSGSTPGNGGNADITANTASIVSYIKSIAINSIITGAPNGQMWNVIQGPLYSNLYNQFTPGNSLKHIINPYYLNVDAIGNANGYIDPNVNYSIISDPQPTANVDTKYSNRPGTVIAYVTTNPVGYKVYGVDNNGNNIGYTPINLSTEVTSQMTQTLANNVTAIYKTLINYVDNNIAQSPNGNQDSMSNLALQQLQSLTVNNAYISSWNSKARTTSSYFNSGYGLVVGYNNNGSSFSDYKGSTIVNVLNDGSGYEVYGVDYTGSKYGYIKVLSVNNLVNNNYKLVVDYLNSISKPASIENLQASISGNFNTSLINPYDPSWNTIALAVDGNNINNQNSVIVCDMKTKINYANYKGSVIVEEHDNSGKHYNVYSIGADGSIIQSTLIKY